jgi:partitioning defective protein 6
MNGYTTIKPKNIISSILGGTPGKPKPLAISNPHDFRQVRSLYKQVLVIYDQSLHTVQ